MTAQVRIEHEFDPPLRGFEAGDGGGMFVTRAEVTWKAGDAPGAVLRGFGAKSDGTMGGSKRVAALHPVGAYAALPAQLRVELGQRACQEALELAEALE